MHLSSAYLHFATSLKSNVAACLTLWNQTAFELDPTYVKYLHEQIQNSAYTSVFIRFQGYDINVNLEE